MKRTLRETLLLSGLALLLAGAAALLHPRREQVRELLFSAPESTLQELRAEKTERLWVDARSREEYLKGHAPGAVHVSPDNWDEGFGELLQVWRPDRQLVVYCRSGSCNTAQAVARRLGRDLRTRETRVLKGGWETWTRQ